MEVKAYIFTLDYSEKLITVMRRGYNLTKEILKLSNRKNIFTSLVFDISVKMKFKPSFVK